MWRDILKIILREIHRTTLDHSLLLTLLGAPILYAFMYGSIYINKVEQKVKMAVIDEDGTYYSRLLTTEINSTAEVQVVPVRSLDEAQEELKYGNVQGYFYIEKDFERKLLSLQQTQVSLAVNASRFLPASDITAAVTKVCLTIGGGVRKIYFNKQGMNDKEAMANTNPISLDYRPLFNESVGYGSFILPGLLAIILHQTLLIGLCCNMTLERQEKTLGQLKNLSKGNLSSILIGKSVFIFLAFVVFSQFFMTVNFSIFDMPLKANYWEVSLLFALLIICIIPMAYLIGSFFKNSLLVVQVMAFSSYPIFMITGYSMPLQALPEGIQFLSNLLPITPFLKLYTLMVQGGASITDQPQQILHMLILGLLFSLLYMWRMKYLMKKEGNLTIS